VWFGGLMRVRNFVLVGFLLKQAALLAGQTGGISVDVLVLNQSNQPVPGVRVLLKNATSVAGSADTDPQGRVEFQSLSPALYEITAAKEGFEPFSKPDLDFSQPGRHSVEVTLVAALSRHESINVDATAPPVEQGASPQAQLPASTAKELPSRPATVADALPLLPGVVRSPAGDLQISGAAEHRSALIVNSADVTDPATGQFGLTVPIDSVESVNFFQTPYLAEYGRFSAGLVSVETRRGGDKFHWELNDPFPDFRIRSWRMSGVKDATPRLNAEGPIIPGKLYFSEGLEYEIRKVEVYELAFPNNYKKKEGLNSFAQLDWFTSSKNVVTGTVHIAPQRLDYVNMDYFNPLPTTPEAATHNYTTNLTDRLQLFGGVLAGSFSMTRFDAHVWGQGPQDLVITPGGNSGNYFEQQDREAARYSWALDYSFAAVERMGTHNFKLGSYLATSSDQGQVAEQPIQIKDATGLLLSTINFMGGRPFQMTDTELAFYGQDHWIISPRLAADLGIRTESQQISQSFRVAPRAGLSWSPFKESGTVIRAGFGIFYDRVPLNVYSFNHYPRQVVTFYDSTGAISAGPYLYGNALSEVDVRTPFVFRNQTPGNFSPYSTSGSVQVEQPLTHALRIRVGYMQNQANGLVIVNPVAPDLETNIGAYQLSGTGQARYRQFEVTARVRLAEEREMFFSYVRSRSRGDLNDFANFLGSFPTPIIRYDQFSNLPGDLPNRFLAWGMIKLPAGFRVAPAVEIRNGFPYFVTDAYQTYVGVPNINRYPYFISVDSRFSKDIKVNPKYTVRLSVSGYNLTNHFNPEAFHSNIADPAFSLFFGQRGRRFTADFDVLF
jgi:hypothetical protein